ncbi:fluoride efflux transporter FluC [Rothia uropygioeca]|uniref:fluoride efflux transporter FluC n=1 Tax=Kocuria sp. 257 TaxID=2021970 RepID=UPI001EE11E1D|nr:CrcB family protein [Kocuria sp. 257]
MSQSNHGIAGGPTKKARPVHLRPAFLGLAFLGGAVGTSLRYALTLFFPGSGSALGAILAINVVGALFLGYVLEALARRGADVGGRRTARVLIGTGILGGFTTYSTLATNVTGLLGSGHIWAGIGYAVLSVVAGVVASGAGILLAARTVGPAVVAADLDDEETPA